MLLMRMPTFMQEQAWAIAIPAIIQVAAYWYSTVSKHVPEPYLDEFFHIPQAQKYCQGDYTWDPKITTPPGLYLVAKLFSHFGCDPMILRMLNVGAITLIVPVCYGIIREVRWRHQDESQEHLKKMMYNEQVVGYPCMILDAHSALNIGLFPPLFFFSALFYTDVMSTLLVLVSYSLYLKKQKWNPSGSVLENCMAVFVGLVALLFRQTNIFWVAVLPAALSAIDVLKKDVGPATIPEGLGIGEKLRQSWNKGFVFDCTVNEAGLEDYALLILSVVLAALKRPFLVLRATIPYLILIVLFAVFVVWNGSVVLGDKSAHTATIHFPQMLYIWPYIVFFSAPLLADPIIQPIVAVLPPALRQLYRKFLPTTPLNAMPALFTLALWSVLGLATVHFNTIIHPYTLADNRHYVFYVFKILRHYPAIKYLAVPVYVGAAGLSMLGLAMPSNEQAASVGAKVSPIMVEHNGSPCHISFTFIWLVTTALSLVTAPLVEPRYFIIPWIMWRLQVLPLIASPSTREKSAEKRYDCRLILETIWLVAINVAVGYAFIYHPFEWASEPGRLQRFLW